MARKPDRRIAKILAGSEHRTGNAKFVLTSIFLIVAALAAVYVFVLR